jgi:hypothetical protein
VQALVARLLLLAQRLDQVGNAGRRAAVDDQAGDVLDGVLVQVEQAAALLGAALPRLGLLLALGERGRS